MYYSTSMQVAEAEEYLSKGRDVLFVTETLEMPREVSVGVIGHHESRLGCELKVNHPHHIGLFNN